MTSTPRRERDHVIDFLRGLALITILLNHFSGFAYRLGYAGFAFPTMTMVGYSSAAEVFFLFSGYLVGLVHVGQRAEVDWRRATLRIVGRMAQIYSMALAVWVLLLALVSVASPDELTAVGLTALAGQPALAARDLLLMREAPMIIDILFVYVLYMGLTPLLIPVLRRLRGRFIVPLLALYGLSQALPELGDVGAGPWNRLAWALPFFGGMTLAVSGALERARDWAGRHPRAIWPLAGALALFTVVFLLDAWGRRLGVVFDLPGADKRHLGPVRVLHVVVVLATAFVFFWRRPRLVASAAGRVICAAGANSLEVFAFGAAYCYGAVLLWHQALPGNGGYVALSLLGIALTLVLGWALSARKRVISTRATAPVARAESLIHGGVHGLAAHEVQPASTGH
ncbi:OpgC domain-containing protein [Derxia gummosa]|uniref:OpgC domain-containing protein n=1 Tax=Derxia gummosa DSM 723 TaxID=1121388 RepID=A0A8B6X1D6_9BURK|nr:OpgC domain-containing protein [Derxia gummosa]